MKKNISLRLVSALICILMTMSLFAGCGGGSVNSANQVLTYNLGAEPETIDPALNQAVDGGNVITACFEGLTRLDEKNSPVPGVAEKWDVSKDGLTYTFHLRKNAKWSDGQSVTAKDFDYAWKRALNPDTEAAYAYQLFYIKNAENYYGKKAAEGDIGIKVVDDYTFVVTLVAPTPYFLELCAFATYMPVRKDIVDKEPKTWATKPETYIGNGPFRMTSYKMKDALEFEKNPNYWNAKTIKLSKMTWVIVVEASSYVVSFEKGEIDLIESPPAADIQRLTEKGLFKIEPYIGTYAVCFNTQKAPFNDARVRRAFNLAIDRQPIIDAVLKAGQKPAIAFVPFGVSDAKPGEDFRTKGGNYFKPEGDLAEAKKLLADAGYPDGVGFPKVTYLYNTSQAHKKIGEALQDMWKKKLGVDVQLQNQDWAVFQKNRQDGNYDFARYGWIGDYMDPMTFLDLWMKGSGNNDCKFDNSEYDSYLNKAKVEPDSVKRMEYMHKAEDILMKEMPLAPLYFYVSTICEQPYVKGIHKTPLGTIYFDHGYIDENLKK